MKPLIALALILASATPVQASVYRNIFNGVQQAGVRIFYKDNCPKRIEGAYMAAKGVMILCSNNVGGQDLYRVLTHEAVHVLQDCFDGSIGDGRIQSMGHTLIERGQTQLVKEFAHEVIGPTLNDHKVKHVQSTVPKGDWASEYEAYSLQDRPEVVLELLKYCNQ